MEPVNGDAPISPPCIAQGCRVKSKRGVCSTSDFHRDLKQVVGDAVQCWISGRAHLEHILTLGARRNDLQFEVDSLYEEAVRHRGGRDLVRHIDLVLPLSRQSTAASAFAVKF